MKTETETEIEVRFKIKNPKKFLAILKCLDSSPVFPVKRGGAEELNLIFASSARSGLTLRLRQRTFSDGTKRFVYTEKGKNQSTVFRKKTETNAALSEEEFKEKLAELSQKAALREVYERHFRAEEYCVYGGVEIELFEFPLVGWYAEFELKRGGLEALKAVMKKFGFTFKDNVQESVHELAKNFCLKSGIPYSPILVFSPRQWQNFCSEHKITYVAPI